MKKRRKGKRGRGLPRRSPRCRLAGVRQDSRAMRAPAKGTASSPLDSGVLTRVGSACRQRGRQRRHVLALFRSVAARCCCAEEEGERQREKEKERMALGFRGGRRGAVLIGRDRRATVGSDPMAKREWAAFRPKQARAQGRFPIPGLGCGLGAGEREAQGSHVRGAWAGFVFGTNYQ